MTANGRKSIFITGAASGIGLAAARRFAAEGWFVGLSDIDTAGLQAAQAALGADNCTTHRLDVRDRNAWDKALAEFGKATGGRLDALLNNAGIANYGFFEDQTDDEADRQIDINIKGVVHGARAGLPLLKATPGSTLINVASCAGLFGSPKMAVYSATKFAVRGLSDALDVEWSRHGVAVRCIMPWFVDTPILQAGSQGSNEKIADTIRQSGSEVYTVEEAADVIWNSIGSRTVGHIVGKAGKRLQMIARFMPGAVRKQLKATLPS
jgi:NAD(P)-dependent dehydrogenase (short-subunit alcohol dehydrogenase family)